MLDLRHAVHPQHKNSLIGIDYLTKDYVALFGELISHVCVWTGSRPSRRLWALTGSDTH